MATLWWHINTYMNKCMWIYIYILIHLYVDIHTYMFVYTLIYMHMCMTGVQGLDNINIYMCVCVVCVCFCAYLCLCVWQVQRVVGQHQSEQGWVSLSAQRGCADSSLLRRWALGMWSGLPPLDFISRHKVGQGLRADQDTKKDSHPWQVSVLIEGTGWQQFVDSLNCPSQISCTMSPFLCGSFAKKKLKPIRWFRPIVVRETAEKCMTILHFKYVHMHIQTFRNKYVEVNTNWDTGYKLMLGRQQILLLGQ